MVSSKVGLVAFLQYSNIIVFCSVAVTMTSRFILNLKEVNSGVNEHGYTTADINLSDIVFRQLGQPEPEFEDEELASRNGSHTNHIRRA
jgi:hypothetical protein